MTRQREDEMPDGATTVGREDKMKRRPPTWGDNYRWGTIEGKAGICQRHLQEAQRIWHRIPEPSRRHLQPATVDLCWLVGYFGSCWESELEWDRVIETLQSIERAMESEAYPAGMHEALQAALDTALEAQNESN